MLDRVLEPEVMDDRAEAVEYNDMNHELVNRNFVTDLLAAGPIGLDCLDLGTGTALIPIELCQRDENVRVMAADASTAMLDLARYQLEISNLVARIQLHYGDAKNLVFETNFFDTVMSNSLVHHLPSHETFLIEALRVLRPNGLLFIRDLCRPESVQALEELVLMHAAGESASSQQMLRQSLHAALSLQEIQELAVNAGLPPECVAMTSDRHWTLQARKTLDDSDAS